MTIHNKNDIAIMIEDIKKKFVKKRRKGLRVTETEHVEALKGVSLNINTGEIYGLLGPNGAGKTTLIKILATIVLPDEGRAFVNGFDAVKQPTKVRASIGATIGGGERSTYWKLSGIENLTFFGQLYGLSKGQARQRGLSLLEDMDLDKKANERVENYSTGMRMKLNIARALISDPPILLFDEPTLGLDPSFAKDLRVYIKNQLQQEQGKTILLTTHYMEEADFLCDRIAFISKGEIKHVDHPDNLKDMMAEDETYRFRIQEMQDNQFSPAKFQEVALTKSVDVIRRNGKTDVVVHARKDKYGLQSYLDFLRQQHVRPISINVDRPTLEDVFIKITGEKLKDEGGS